jgi:hypothetical protein
MSSTTNSSRSWSNKDLPSLTAVNAATELNKPRIQVATERLHELFMSLRELETRENNEPFQPDAFLQALRYSFHYVFINLNYNFLSYLS